MNWEFDSDRMDQEVLLERMGYREYNTSALLEIFGCHPETLREGVATGRIPVPAYPWNPNYPKEQKRWTKEQVIDMLMLKDWPRPKGPAPREHGTARGGEQHYARREPLCDLCRPPTRAHRVKVNKAYRQRVGNPGGRKRTLTKA